MCSPQAGTAFETFSYKNDCSGLPATIRAQPSQVDELTPTRFVLHEAVERSSAAAAPAPWQ
jgi:hypothetical protein